MKTFPAHGLYVRHAQRIAAVDCSFVTEKPDARPAILFDNQSSGFVSGLRSQHAPAEAVVARHGGRVKAAATVHISCCFWLFPFVSTAVAAPIAPALLLQLSTTPLLQPATQNGHH